MESNDGMKLEGIGLARATGLIMVMDTPKGRGVFADKDIPARTLLEVSPVLVLDPVENEQHVRKTDLYNYTYNWPYEDPRHLKSDSGNRTTTTQAIILGLGSLFNHSTYRQNVGWVRDVPNKIITYRTLRDIKRGEELCISYGDRLTFIDTDARLVDSEDENEDMMLNRIELV